MNGHTFFIDIYCLFDAKYAGIANVNYQIAKYFFYQYPESSYFFYNDKILRRDFVEFLLSKKSGEGLLDYLRYEQLYINSLDGQLLKNKEKSIGIFPYLKAFKKKFSYEIQIIYDLTPLLTPEFHHPETVKRYLQSIDNLITNDLFVCISESTKEDIIMYLGIPQDKIVVSHLGLEMENFNHSIYRKIIQEFEGGIEKFIIVLGTIEPRKNIRLIFSFLEHKPEILKKYKFVFVGRDAGKEGWGETFHEKIEKLNIPDSLKKNIHFLEYVTDEEKNILLMKAEFLIYPSIYEGFGLPVLEALYLGCPVLGSMSSSIPEIGENAVFYFDPYDLKSFVDAFKKIEISLEKNRNEIIEEGYRRSKIFTWERFISNILKRIEQDFEGNRAKISLERPQVFVQMSRPLQVLLIKLDHRGDFILSIPAILKIKDKLKKIDLDILVGEWNYIIAQKLNIFRNIYIYNYFAEISSQEASQNNFEPKEIFGKLPFYDLAIDLRRAPETRFLLEKVPSLFKIGYKSFSPFDAHLDICLDTQLDQKGIIIDDNKISVSLQLIRLINAIPFEVVHLPAFALFSPKGCQIGIFPGAGVDSRQWPLEYFLNLVKELGNIPSIEKINIYIAPYEKKLIESFSVIPKTQICSGLNFEELTNSLIQNLLIISNNSFGAHIASYLGIPLIAIYSGVETVAEWGPPFGNAYVFCHKLSCSPCHGLAKHCTNNLICLKEIQPNVVLNLIREIITVNTKKQKENEERFFLYSFLHEMYPKIGELFKSIS